MKNVKNMLFIFAIIAFLFIAHTTYANQINPMEATEVMVVADDDYQGIDPNGYNPFKAHAEYNNTHIDQEAINKFVAPLYVVLMWVAVIASVIVLSIIGLKFIIGSASEKAEYKQHLMPFVVGILVVVFLFTMLKVLSKLAEKIY